MYTIVYFRVLSVFCKYLYIMDIIWLFMKRKIVQHGSSSLTITLPMNFVDKFGLKKGDEVDVEESGTTLIVATQKGVAVNKKTIKDGDFTANNLSHLFQL